MQFRAVVEPFGCLERADLIGLTAEADHQNRMEIHMSRIAGERAAEQRHALAVHVHAAANGMRHSDHAVYVRIVFQRITAKVIRD